MNLERLQRSRDSFKRASVSVNRPDESRCDMESVLKRIKEGLAQTLLEPSSIGDMQADFFVCFFRYRITIPSRHVALSAGVHREGADEKKYLRLESQIFFRKCRKKKRARRAGHPRTGLSIHYIIFRFYFVVQRGKGGLGAHFGGF